MTAGPTEPAAHAHEMGIYKRHFDLIVRGRKTIEIRVNDASRQKIKEGSLARGVVRDSKNPDGPTLSVDVTALVAAVKAGQIN